MKHRGNSCFVRTEIKIDPLISAGCLLSKTNGKANGRVQMDEIKRQK